MECFTEFYELLENLTQPPVIEEGDELGIVDDDFKSDLSADINEKYFDKIDQASSMILSFYERYIADTRMHVAWRIRMKLTPSFRT